MTFLQKYLVLVLVVVSISMYALALWSGANAELAVLAASMLSLAVAWWLERVLPYRPTWNADHGDFKVDLASAGVLVALVDPLAKLLAPIALVWLYALVPWRPLEAALPLWMEIAAVLLLVEFGKYASHRLHHRWSPLWWLHAMHHSSERLYFLNGLRFHPLNHLLNYAIALLPAMALGASPEAMLGYLALTQPVVLIQHANIDLRHGWLNRVFSTPEVHRWHHSTEPDEANRNFGSALLLWDHVFGTFKPADGFGDSRQVGLFAASRDCYPGRRSYLAQLASMFRPPCCAA
jgi:ornithine lipid hydroxylase